MASADYVNEPVFLREELPYHAFRYNRFFNCLIALDPKHFWVPEVHRGRIGIVRWERYELRCRLYGFCPGPMVGVSDWTWFDMAAREFDLKRFGYYTRPL